MMRTVALGPRLRKLRKKHGVTLRDLADACGIYFTLINKYENEERELSEETFWQLREGIDKVLERKKEEERDRQALAELFEKGEIDRDTRLALINRFFAEPSFRATYVDKYDKFGALHPGRHLTREQAEAIRARAKESLAHVDERIAERERLLAALQSARTTEEKEARLAAYEALASSIEESLRQEVEQERKEKEMYKRALERAEADDE